MGIKNKGISVLLENLASLLMLQALRTGLGWGLYKSNMLDLYRRSVYDRYLRTEILRKNAAVDFATFSVASRAL